MAGLTKPERFTVRRSPAAGGRSAGLAGRRADAHCDAVRDTAAAENYLVAPFFLTPTQRADMLAVYASVRFIDDVCDGTRPAHVDGLLLGLPAARAGDPLAVLDAFDADLTRVFDPCGGTPRHPLLRALQPTVIRCELPAKPFFDLVEATRGDLRVRRHASFEDVLAYCERAANPVGRLVLQVMGARLTPERLRGSDAICSALQIVDHLQDAAEDLRRDRIYIPTEDMARFGVSEADLAAPTAAPHVRELIDFEARRAQRLLADGIPLVRGTCGRLKLLLAGSIAGGRATLGAIAAGHDVLAGPPKATRGACLRELAATLRAAA
jgi:squalene synthase HpnC